MNTQRPEAIRIIGGGVAGLALGVGLQKRGIPTAVFDKGAYPRHRVCGEFVCGVRPETLRILGLDTLFQKALRHKTTVWTIGGEEVFRADLPFSALGISRYCMDQVMAEEFVQLGGVLQCQTTFESDEPRALTGTIWATGRKRQRGPWLGLKVHCRDFALRGDLEVHLGRQAYVGASAVENGRVNVCGLFRKIPGTRGRGLDLFYRYLEAADLSDLQDKIARSNPDVGSYCGVSHFSFSRGFPFKQLENQAPASFNLGDQWGVIPPFTGNGMSIALETAALAVDPLVRYWNQEYGWDRCVSEFQRNTRRHLKTRFRVANAIQPMLLNPMTQKWVAKFAQSGWLPFGSLFALTHGN